MTKKKIVFRLRYSIYTCRVIYDSVCTEKENNLEISHFLPIVHFAATVCVFIWI